MITVDGTAQAAIDAGARGFAILVEMDFLSGTQYVTTWPVSIVTAGHTYIGIGSLGSVSGLSESEDRSARKVKLALAIVNQAMLATLIGPAGEYRRRRARIYQQMMTETFVPAGTPIHRWTGFMDKVMVDRDAPSSVNGSPGLGQVIVECSRAGVPGSRRKSTLRSTHQQQIAKYPGDLGLEYQQELLEKPSLWLSKRFQEV